MHRNHSYSNPEAMAKSGQDSQLLKQDLQCGCCFELMVEPTTLSCGHSFCRFCLAKWWHASRHNTCPECRQPWSGFPKVNIALRWDENKFYFAVQWLLPGQPHTLWTKCSTFLLWMQKINLLFSHIIKKVKQCILKIFKLQIYFSFLAKFQDFKYPCTTCYWYAKYLISCYKSTWQHKSLH